MVSVKIQTQFEDFHCWPDAPEEVDFLRSNHRHIFKVSVKIEVNHDDREIEFFILQRQVNNIIETSVKPMEQRKSCEDMAEVIMDYLEVIYPSRFIEVEVSEDGENSSIVNNYE